MDPTQNLRRLLRPAGKTAQAGIRWKRFSFQEAPRVFGNARPKSGSHLFLQILNGFTRIMPYRYVEADPVRTVQRAGGKCSPEDILTDLKKIPPGVIGWGYVDATPQNVSFLTSSGRVTFFIYRDPRDLLVS